MQRFGSALNLNVHFHTKAIDGVFRQSTEGRLTFFPFAAPTSEHVREVLDDLICRLQPILGRLGMQTEDAQESDPLARESDVLAAVYAGSVVRRCALGPSRLPRTRGGGSRSAPACSARRSWPAWT